MSDPQNSHQGDHETPNPSPQSVSGGRMVSLAGLREKIEAEFIAETTLRPDLLADSVDDTIDDSTSESARRNLIRDVADYVLMVETIKLSRAERLTLLDDIYRDLFSFGPLSAAFEDESISEITIDGPNRVYIRRAAEDMQPSKGAFDDALHLERLVGRVLATAEAQLSERDPILEVGVMLAKRPVRLSVIGVPISSSLHVEMRLHPRQPATLSGLVAAGFLDEAAAQLLTRIIAAGYGLMITGDVGTGKTTLLEALLPLLPGGIAVERAAELRIPPAIERLTAVPASAKRDPVDFGAQIIQAVGKQPHWLAVDEIRFDETAAMWAAITDAGKPGCIWAFRAASEALRLRAAFSMSVRRVQAGIDQELIHSALADRLSFVAQLIHRDHKLHLLRIGEWQRSDPASLQEVDLRELWPIAQAEPQHPLG